MTKDSIIFEDDHIVVLNKPSGLVVNISQTSPENTLQDYLQEAYKLPVEGSEFADRSGIVHRLDKDTSGVMVSAKTPDAFEHLKAQFKDRQTGKEYIGLVLGEVKDAKFEIDAPIKRDPKHRMKMAIVKDGRNAKTAAELLQTIEKEAQTYSYLRLTPESGRTHQLRVHLAAANHPIAADPIYMTRKQFEQSVQLFPRLMLHARKLEFNHPNTNKELTFEAPLPPEFQDLDI